MEQRTPSPENPQSDPASKAGVRARKLIVDAEHHAERAGPVVHAITLACDLTPTTAPRPPPCESFPQAAVNPPQRQ
ncbi:MAG TPA: hypothetical protein VIJ00_10305 [Nakamurella sp.]